MKINELFEETKNDLFEETKEIDEKKKPKRC